MIIKLKKSEITSNKPKKVDIIIDLEKITQQKQREISKLVAQVVSK